MVRQADLLGPLVAELEGQGEVVLLDAAASFVGKGPVVGVGDEVVDLFSGEWEEGLGGGCTDTHDCCLWSATGGDRVWE